ncbi:protein kinase [Streptomyces sp. NPDC050535]|uniref:serine/threonine protein kinase n=1 Tax=Streptomyces sp. NPDC050535 TaxID=3365626 RepID=UPI0037BD0C8F
MQGVLLAERFRIGDRLGAGGMGQVWSAQDERMRRDVAVKVVHPQFGMDEAETQARFQREVQLAGRLSHQNIVTVHDWGEVPVDGRHTLYLVMELVLGVPLQKRLRESAVPWPLAVGWAAQISRALDAAHGQGVVHRDIKPANVLLTPEGTVKVLDFGVAKFMGETIGARDLTVTGAPLGSPAYMSPEQAEGNRDIDHRSDLYSLGCLLYHAVTGRQPFSSTTQWAVLRMQMEDTPTAPAVLAEGLPGGLNDLILALLAKRPEDRPADAAAVFDALSTVLVDHALTLPGGNILDAAQLGQGEALSGRLLNKAWGLWQLTETRSAARRAEAERLKSEAQDSADRVRAEAQAAAERLAAEGAEALAVAQEEAVWRRREAGELLGSARQEADQERERARGQSEELLASARKRVEESQEEAVRLVEEADRRATEMVSNAVYTADRTRTQAKDDSEAYRAKTVELQEEARRLRTEAERLHADAVAKSELVRSQGRREVVQSFDEEVRAAEGVLGRGPAVDESPAPQLLAKRRAKFLAAVVSALAKIDAAPQAAHGLPQPAPAPESPPFGFDLVRRGYDIKQVDERIAELVTDRDRALSRVVELGRQIEEAVPPPDFGPFSVDPRGDARHLGGSLVNGAYQQAEWEIEARSRQTRQPLQDFELVPRGYDRRQVDARISQLVDERDRVLACITALERLTGGRF